MIAISKHLAVIVASVAFSGVSVAAVTAEEAAQLGANLTAFGAEKAGNADGSIPAYTGELVSPPASYEPGSGRFPDPFASEQVILKIDAKNADQYKDQLTPGVLALMKQYPTFHVNVYPTHRTTVYPEAVLENSIKNATSAELAGDASFDDAIENAYGGVPFPIPKNGAEALWNFRLRFQPAGLDQRQSSYLVDSSGRSVFLGRYLCKFMNAYYDPAATSLSDPYFSRQLCLGESPASQAGYNLLITESADFGKYDRMVWVYTPGQRRVRTAPEFSYDTPAANFGGALTYDEVNVYSGRSDRFDLKLVGKKEMYVPYNNNRLFDADWSLEQFLTPKHPNPDSLRFEKHRVWVVEATLKTGKRHVLSRRTFFIDEDSWLIVATDGYDQAGELYRVGITFPFLAYENKGAVPFLSGQVYSWIDLNKGEYFASSPGEKGSYVTKPELPSVTTFTSSRLAATGVR
ncbi:MAG: DUF1329 domain-containing protein [Pseudomonas sp.]|uniref:DUF1329 domain-containing protein n=1 Tax=Pseudomonas sp. TaxID=306 RepID=UPI003982560E